MQLAQLVSDCELSNVIQAKLSISSEFKYSQTDFWFQNGGEIALDAQPIPGLQIHLRAAPHPESKRRFLVPVRS
jgi:hypothetical protein